MTNEISHLPLTTPTPKPIETEKKRFENTLSRMIFNQFWQRNLFSLSHLKWQSTLKTLKNHEIWSKMAINSGTPIFRCDSISIIDHVCQAVSVTLSKYEKEDLYNLHGQF